MDSTERRKMKLFRLLFAPGSADCVPYIPDCLGDSLITNPLYDDFGRDCVWCFLVDKDGRVGVFFNRRKYNYVPYNTLFNIEKYNECLKLLFPPYIKDDDCLIYILYLYEHSHLRKKKPLLENYASGMISWSSLLKKSMRGHLMEAVEQLFNLIRVSRIMLRDKWILRMELDIWKERMKFYQRRGLYAFAPHPQLKKLIKIYRPYRDCREEVLRAVRTVGQHVPLSFREIDALDFDYLRELWMKNN